MLLIPSIDILGGRTVRLRQGDYAQVTTYDADPVEVARSFGAAGAHRVHVVDLDAARGQGENLGVVASIVAAAAVDVEVGGGVRSPEAVERVLATGAKYVVVGTVAAERPGEVAAWCRRWPQQVYIGVDARGDQVAIHGWERSSAWSVKEMFGHFRDAPIAGFVYTDISRDGLLEGVEAATLVRVVSATTHPVTVGGGMTSVADLVAAREAGAAGAIVGRAIYEGRLTVAEALAAAD